MHRQSSRHGISLIELIVVITVIAVLIGLLLPAVYAVRQAVNRTECANNLRQIGMAYHGFVDAHNGRATAFTVDSHWTDQLKPYLGNQEQVFFCGNDSRNKVEVRHVTDLPSGHRTGYSDAGEVLFDEDFPGGQIIHSVWFELHSVEGYIAMSSYGVNSNAQKLNLTDDSQKVLAIEYSGRVIYAGIGEASDVWPTDAALRHNGVLNVLFMDGSVRGMAQAEINPTVTEIYNEYWRPWILR